MKFKKGIKIGMLKLAYIMAVAAMMAGIAGMLVVNAGVGDGTKSCSANLESKARQHMEQTGQTEYEHEEICEKVVNGEKNRAIYDKFTQLSEKELQQMLNSVKEILSKNYNKSVEFVRVDEKEMTNDEKEILRKMFDVTCCINQVGLALKKGKALSEEEIKQRLHEQVVTEIAKRVNGMINNGKITKNADGIYVIKVSK